jgi:Predicted permeases
MLDLVYLILLMLTGFTAGTFGGLLGLGGATILVPALALGFGLPIHMVIAIALVSNVFVSITSAIGYGRRGLIHRKPVLVMNLGSIAGIAIGTYVATQTPADIIKVLFGSFLLVMIFEAALRIAADAARRKPAEVEETAPEPEHVNVPGFTLLGFAMGLMGALIGIGGGTIAVPVQNVLFKIPLRNAIANSLTTIIVSASVGAVLYFILSGELLFSTHDALITAAIIVPGSVAGALSATAIAHRVPARYIKLIFYAAILYVAVNMIKSGMGW